MIVINVFYIKNYFISFQYSIKYHQACKGHKETKHHHYSAPEGNDVACPDAFTEENAMMIEAFNANITFDAMIC